MDNIITSEELWFLLQLVDIEIPQDVLDTWSNTSKLEAFKWAASSYYRASDNDVKVPLKPTVLADYNC